MTPDTWHPTITADLRRLEAALHDVVDIPDEGDGTTVLYEPDDDTDIEAAKLRRSAHRCINPKCDGDCDFERDADYLRIQDPQVRMSGPSDPTGRRVSHWGDRIVAVGTQLVTFTVAWHREAAAAISDLNSHAIDHDTRLADLPHAVTWVDPATGREHVNIGPSNANRLIHWHIVHTIDCADVIRDTWTAYPYDDSSFRWRADDLGHRTRHMIRRQNRYADRPDPTRAACLNPHGKHRHRAGPGAVNGICRSCVAPLCNDELDRGCKRRLSPADHDRGRSNCAACRKAKSRQKENA